MLYRTILTLFFLALLPSCSALLVVSDPPGAEILINGNDTGYKTPHSMKWKDLAKHGDKSPYKVEVRLEGYPDPPPQFAKAKVAKGRIVWSIIFPIPIGIIHMFRGFKKMMPRTMYFMLKK